MGRAESSGNISRTVNTALRQNQLFHLNLAFFYLKAKEFAPALKDRNQNLFALWQKL